MTSKSKNPRKRPKIVITPVGPKPKDQTHSVKLDEVVGRKDNGTLAVVSKRRTIRKEKTLANGDELVLTPFSYRS